MALSDLGKKRLTKCAFIVTAVIAVGLLISGSLVLAGTRTSGGDLEVVNPLNLLRLGSLLLSMGFIFLVVSIVLLCLICGCFFLKDTVEVECEFYRQPARELPSMSGERPYPVASGIEQGGMDTVRSDKLPSYEDALAFAPAPQFFKN